MLEVRHANLKKRVGYSHNQAIQSAKHMGLRRKRGEFDNIKWDLYRKMQAAGFGKHWIDVIKYPPTPDVLSWCVQLLPRTEDDSMVAGDDLSVSCLLESCSPFGVKLSSAMESSSPDVGGTAPSMVGAAPALGHAIDQYRRGRGSRENKVG